MIENLINYPMEYTEKEGSDVWKFKILRPRDKTGRASLAAQFLNLAPLESVAPEDYSRAFSLATLQVAYIEGPSWFKDKFKEQFADFPDEDYMVSLYNKILKREADFSEAKKKFRLPNGGQERAVDTGEPSF